MKAVVIGALAATAYSADTIIYPGTYKAVATTGQVGSTTDCCWPDASGVTVEAGTTAGQYKVSWTFGADPSSYCAPSNTAAGLAVSGSAAPTTATVGTPGDITFTSKIGGTGTDETWKLEAPDAVTGSFVLNLDSADAGSGGCSVTLLKDAPTATVTYPGVYTTTPLGTTGSCCYPEGDVIIKTATSPSTGYDLEWTFDDSTTTCKTTNVASSANPVGAEVSGNGDADATTKDITFTDTLPSGTAATTFVLDAAPQTSGNFVLNLGDLYNPEGDCAVALTRRTLPDLTYPRVYEVDGTTGTAATCCYPEGDITVTQDSTTKLVTVAWTFGEQAGCGTTYKGQAITGGAIPDTVTKSVTFTDTNAAVLDSWTLNYPVTSDADWTLDLSSVSTGCSVVLDTKSGYLLGLGSLVAVSLSYLMF